MIRECPSPAPHTHAGKSLAGPSVSDTPSHSCRTLASRGSWHWKRLATDLTQRVWFESNKSIKNAAGSILGLDHIACAHAFNNRTKRIASDTAETHLYNCVQPARSPAFHIAEPSFMARTSASQMRRMSFDAAARTGAKLRFKSRYQRTRNNWSNYSETNDIIHRHTSLSWMVVTIDQSLYKYRYKKKKTFAFNETAQTLHRCRALGVHTHSDGMPQARTKSEQRCIHTPIVRHCS